MVPSSGCGMLTLVQEKRFFPPLPGFRGSTDTMMPMQGGSYEQEVIVVFVSDHNSWLTPLSISILSSGTASHHRMSLTRLTAWVMIASLVGTWYASNFRTTVRSKHSSTTQIYDCLMNKWRTVHVVMICNMICEEVSCDTDRPNIWRKMDTWGISRCHRQLQLHLNRGMSSDWTIKDEYVVVRLHLKRRDVIPLHLIGQEAQAVRLYLIWRESYHLGMYLYSDHSPFRMDPRGTRIYRV